MEYLVLKRKGKGSMTHVEERLERRTVPISKPITMNKIPFPGIPRKKGQKQKSDTTKDDLPLLGLLYIL